MTSNDSSQKAHEFWQNFRKNLVQRFRSRSNSKAAAGESQSEEEKW
jgi:CRISPR/Cas system endoribonuclease Cas6 (RAMP superfamily)